MTPVCYEERTVRKTRKDHTCCECGNVIPAGSPCGVATGIWDRKARTFRWCMPCDLLRREVLDLIEHFDDEPLIFGELLMHVRECL